ncbi:MAG: BON domain-containing protein [Acidobacteriia bacterium]|nr:BON domain-containing protein [Terriglobia bacterium]
MRNLGLTVMMLAASLPMASAADAANSDLLVKQVRHELVMLPYLGVFDHMAFHVADGVVTLSGQVTRPTLKTSAGNVVRRLEGVMAVKNEIEVLPLSPNDDRIRIAVVQAVYGYPALQRYALGSQPSIRIIVKNGDLTLEGVVANQGEKDLVNIRANGVAGVFKVTNKLQVENPKA